MSKAWPRKQTKVILPRFETEHWQPSCDNRALAMLVGHLLQNLLKELGGKNDLHSSESTQTQ